ncbi:MAG: M1 family metallopeptidase [Salibacteraceae bacterium]
MTFRKIAFTGLMMLACLSLVQGQENTNQNNFRQLKQELATPNVYRTASGAPGHQYWQQRADYDMQITLDDEKQRIEGVETVTYYNNSPDPLKYLWLQLDQNRRAKDSDTYKIQSGTISDDFSPYLLNRLHIDFDGGFKLGYVKDASGKDLPYTVNKTMMRIDLPQTLKPKGSFTFKIKWSYNINDRMKIGGRSGYEYFADEDNYLYTIAQFFPRMAVYSEVEGWQHKQFLGRGEFALTFGNYKVQITVPADHIVAATGTLQNASKVLSSEQRSRYDKAKKSDEPVMIVTPEEALENEKKKAKGTKTWVFQAENVRDFGFASSRKFIWDAQGVTFGNRTVMAMSYYPKEGNPLWEKYSTRVVAHTLKTYSHYTFPYPYPVAISVHANSIGMEYPMICFNGGRPESDGTYTARTKYGMISVIIHEVGHNYFPMIVNSDERQWTWMDEGLNTFLQYLTEQEWDRNYPSRRGPAPKIVSYMSGEQGKMVPIMTNSESIYQFGNNAYGKPAAGLNILRETIMGRELFDFAFKQYAQRWQFKHPTPADFFRTMEDASGVDLDWFWRGWFYTTNPVDISLDAVRWFQIDTRNPEIEKPFQKAAEAAEIPDISAQRNLESTPKTVLEAQPELNDFYNLNDPFEVLEVDKEDYQRYLEGMDSAQLALINAGYHYYELQFTNKGGLVMPLILRFEFADGTFAMEHIPAEIWRMDEKTISKIFFFEKEVVGVTLDPNRETADINTNDNAWPRQVQPSRFTIYKNRAYRPENPMQRKQRNDKKAEN